LKLSSAGCLVKPGLHLCDKYNTSEHVPFFLCLCLWLSHCEPGFNALSQFRIKDMG